MKQLRFLFFGQFSFILGFLCFMINTFLLNGNFILALLSGVLFGLSLVLNLNYLRMIKYPKINGGFQVQKRW